MAQLVEAGSDRLRATVAAGDLGEGADGFDHVCLVQRLADAGERVAGLHLYDDAARARPGVVGGFAEEVAHPAESARADAAGHDDDSDHRDKGDRDAEATSRVVRSRGLGGLGFETQVEMVTHGSTCSPAGAPVLRSRSSAVSSSTTAAAASITARDCFVSRPAACSCCCADTVLSPSSTSRTGPGRIRAASAAAYVRASRVELLSRPRKVWGSP